MFSLSITHFSVYHPFGMKQSEEGIRRQTADATINEIHHKAMERMKE